MIVIFLRAATECLLPPRKTTFAVLFKVNVAGSFINFAASHLEDATVSSKILG